MEDEGGQEAAKLFGEVLNKSAMEDTDVSGVFKQLYTIISTSWLFTNEGVEECNKIRQDVAYQGFDPVVIGNKLLELGKDRDVKMDLLLLIILGVERGSKVDKIKKKIKEKIISKIEEIVRIYEVKDTGRQLSNTDITIPRVMNTMAHITVPYTGNSGSHPILEVSAVRMEIGVDIPKAMIATAFASMIPMSAEYDMLQEFHCLVQVMVSRLIGPKKLTDLERYNQAMNIAGSGRRSTFEPKGLRINILRMVDIVDGLGKIQDKWVPEFQKMKAKILG